MSSLKSQKFTKRKLSELIYTMHGFPIIFCAKNRSPVKTCCMDWVHMPLCKYYCDVHSLKSLLFKTHCQSKIETIDRHFSDKLIFSSIKVHFISSSSFFVICHAVKSKNVNQAGIE